MLTPIKLRIRRTGRQSFVKGKLSRISVKSRTSKLVLVNTKNGSRSTTSGKILIATGKVAGKVGGFGLKGALKTGKSALRFGNQALVAHASAAGAGDKSLAESQGASTMSTSLSFGRALVSKATDVGNRAGASLGKVMRPKLHDAMLKSLGQPTNARVTQLTKRIVGPGSLRKKKRMVYKRLAKGNTLPKRLARRAVNAAARGISSLIARIITLIVVKLSVVLLSIFVLCTLVILVLAIIASFIPSWLAGDEADHPRQATTINNVPAEWAADIIRAGSRCPQDGITPQLIAAQLSKESTWDPGANNSSSGAQGLAQFIPSTWASYGVDGDGDGVADALNGHDAIASQANYMCYLAQTMRDYKSRGLVTGDLVELTLAAYNAGPNAVLDAGGIPAIGETEDYVSEIVHNATNYEVAYASGGAGAQSSADQLNNTDAINAGSYPAEDMTMPDPTPGAHGTAMITPRMYALINEVISTYPQVLTPALYCWDSHPYNSYSDHPKGKACDIPFYSCSADPTRAADPVTGTGPGNAAANWLVANAGRLGIHYIIWAGQEWDAETGKWTGYDGAAGLYDVTDCSGGHYDHIHVSVY